ncbi:MAG: hypothetical protein CJBNEKGG_03388 [Prosthecobacter sp.]|nr:hypothetical protein [Prosthecobacter sp.]
MTTHATANKTDAGNGSKAICRVSNLLRSPSPDPRRSPKNQAPPAMTEASPRIQSPAESHEPSRWLRWIPPRVRAFFSRGDQICLHSAVSADALIVRLRKGLGSVVWGSHGASGYLFGTSFHVCWATGMFRDSFAPVFHGQIVSSGSSSIIRGYFSHNRFAKLFVSVWCGGIILMSVIFVWTIFMPLAGLGLLWALNGMMAIGESLHPGREQKILDFLQATCDANEI